MTDAPRSPDVSAGDRTQRDADVQRARDLLDAYHDRELSDEEKAFVENALAKYPELTKESSMIIGIKNVLAQYEGEDVTPDFSDSLLERIQNDDAGGGFWRKKKILIPCIVLIVAAIGILLYYWLDM